MRDTTFTKAVATAGAVTLLTSGCLSSGTSSSGGKSGGTAKTTVEIMFGFGGDQSQGFKDSLEPWAKTNGITIKYVSSGDSFATLVRSRVAGNNPPDIAIFPQPGLLKDLQKQGKLQPLDDVLDMPKLQSSIVPGFLDSAAVGGKHYGVPVDMNVKSLVFYNKPGLHGCGLQDSQDHRRADDPQRQDQGLGHGTVVHWGGVGAGERLARHRLD